MDFLICPPVQRNNLQSRTLLMFIWNFWVKLIIIISCLFPTSIRMSSSYFVHTTATRTEANAQPENIQNMSEPLDDSRWHACCGLSWASCPKQTSRKWQCSVINMTGLPPADRGSVSWLCLPVQHAWNVFINLSVTRLWRSYPTRDGRSDPWNVRCHGRGDLDLEGRECQHINKSPWRLDK